MLAAVAQQWWKTQLFDRQDAISAGEADPVEVPFNFFAIPAPFEWPPETVERAKALAKHVIDIQTDPSIPLATARNVGLYMVGHPPGLLGRQLFEPTRDLREGIYAVV